MLFFLVVIALKRLLSLSESRTFAWFFWTYNLGVGSTVSMLVVQGSMTVLGHEAGPAIAGIAGMGHIFITVGLVLLFVALKRRLLPNYAESKSPVAELHAN